MRVSNGCNEEKGNSRDIKNNLNKPVHYKYWWVLTDIIKPQEPEAFSIMLCDGYCKKYLFNITHQYIAVMKRLKNGVEKLLTELSPVYKQSLREGHSDLAKAS